MTEVKQHKKNSIDNNTTFDTIRINKIDLLNYLQSNVSLPLKDPILTVVSNQINRMILKANKGDIPLNIKDIEYILEEGDLAVFSSVKGNDIDTIVTSLSYSVTAKVGEIKGCLIHIISNKDYPISSIEKIIYGFENKLGQNLDTCFIFGQRLSDEMGDDEVLLRILCGIVASHPNS